MPRTSKGRAFFRVGVAQINTTVGDIKINSQKIVDALEQAKVYSPDLVVFPEMAITGYPPEDLLYSPSFVQANLNALRSLARRSKDIPFVVGFVDRLRSGALCNAAAFIRNGRVETIYHKRELPNYGVFDERRYFVPGATDGIITYSPQIKLGISICEDMWIKDSFLYRKGFADKLACIINISASPYHASKHHTRVRIAGGLARHTKRPVVYANLVGGQDELVFDGGSMILDGRGKVLAEAPLLREGWVWADLPCAASSGQRKRPPLPRGVKNKVGPDKEVYDALVLGTRDYIDKNGFGKVIIGLSGGIDSALVASIACDALGPERVVGLTMPSRYTSNGTLSDATLLAQNLGFACHTISIEPLFKSYLETLEPYFRDSAPNIAEENLQARIRGNLLMALSNKRGYLVLTTGNKSEMATGYCTLYGDMAGGFAVIKDVPKTLVFKLARYRNRIAGQKAWIPISTIDRAPTAELKPDQKDQDTLPPYTVLDSILKDIVENDRLFVGAKSKSQDAALVRRVTEMVLKSEYKRRQAPPGIKITPKAFGRDRRMPITNKFVAS